MYIASPLPDTFPEKSDDSIRTVECDVYMAPPREDDHDPLMAWLSRNEHDVTVPEVEPM
jgi:hypothetical protein